MSIRNTAACCNIKATSSKGAAWTLLILMGQWPGAGFGQSLDCARATTPIEKAICTSSNLAAADAKLAAQVEDYLDAPNIRRDDVLKDQRNWLQRRDQNCAREIADSKKFEICLMKEYQSRSDELVKAAPPAPGELALCESLVERYKKTVSTPRNLAYEKGDVAEGARPLLDVFSDDKESGIVGSIVKEEPIADFIVPKELSSDEEALNSERRKKWPFKFSNSVKNAYKELNSLVRDINLYQIPNENYYYIEGVGGVFNCVVSISLKLHNGIAQLTSGVPTWKNDNGSCSVSHSFGTIDGRLAAFEYSYDVSHSSGFPHIRYLNISTWRKGRFVAACGVSAKFASVYATGRRGEFDEQDHCQAGECEKFRATAKTIVEKMAAENPANKQNADDEPGLSEKLTPAAVAAKTTALSPDQKRQFTSLVTSAMHLGVKNSAATQSVELAPEIGSDTDYVDFFPAVVDEKIYLAVAGHLTRSEFTPSDWIVDFFALENDRLKQKASIVVTDRPGALLQITAFKCGVGQCVK